MVVCCRSVRSRSAEAPVIKSVLELLLSTGGNSASRGFQVAAEFALSLHRCVSFTDSVFLKLKQQKSS